MDHTDKTWLEIVLAEKESADADPWKVLLALAAGLDALHAKEETKPEKED